MSKLGMRKNTTGHSATIESFWSIYAVYMRYFDVFRKSLLYYAVTTLAEPIFSLLSFGLGLGSIVGTIHVHQATISYRKFIFSGIAGQTLLFQAFFEASYGAYIRMYYQRIFQSMATTPITLSEVLWGELIWGATKASVSASVVILIGIITGDFLKTSLLCAFPVCFVSAMLFSGLGLWVAAISKSIDHMSYPQHLLVFPMFLFCGVFYPIETLPIQLQYIVWVFPLTASLSLIRAITLGLPFQAGAIFSLLFWWSILVFGARRAMIRRLIK